MLNILKYLQLLPYTYTLSFIVMRGLTTNNVSILRVKLFDLLGDDGMMSKMLMVSELAVLNLYRLGFDCYMGLRFREFVTRLLFNMFDIC